MSLFLGLQLSLGGSEDSEIFMQEGDNNLQNYFLISSDRQLLISSDFQYTTSTN